MTPSVMAIGLKSSGEAGGRGRSTTLAMILSVTSGFSNFFFLTNLEVGVKTLGAPGLSWWRPFRMRSVIFVGRYYSFGGGPHQNFCLGLRYSNFFGNNSRMMRRSFCCSARCGRGSRMLFLGMSGDCGSMFDNPGRLMYRRNRRRFRFRGNWHFFGCSCLFGRYLLGMRQYCGFGCLVRRRHFDRRRFGRQHFRYRLRSCLFDQLSRFPVIVFATLARR